LFKLYPKIKNKRRVFLQLFILRLEVFDKQVYRQHPLLLHECSFNDNPILRKHNESTIARTKAEAISKSNKQKQ